MRQPDVIITVIDPVEVQQTLEGRSFQVHVKPGGRLLLIPLEIKAEPPQCPVWIGGEQCGGVPGHSGKHCWSGGD